MADLRPTKARLALLAEIAAGNVVIDLLSAERIAWIRRGPTVTARLRDLRRAGWAAVAQRDPNSRTAAVLLTDAGKAVLNQGSTS